MTNTTISAQVKAEYWKVEQEFCEQMIDTCAKYGDLHGLQVAMDNFERANDQLDYFTKEAIANSIGVSVY